MLKVKAFVFKCRKHPRYNGESEDAIKGGCLDCWRVLDVRNDVKAMEIAYGLKLIISNVVSVKRKR